MEERNACVQVCAKVNLQMFCVNISAHIHIKCPQISLTCTYKNIVCMLSMCEHCKYARRWNISASMCVFLPCGSFQSVHFHKWSCRRRWEWWPFSTLPPGSKSSPGWDPPCQVWNRSCDCLKDKPALSKGHVKPYLTISPWLLRVSTFALRKTPQVSSFQEQLFLLQKRLWALLFIYSIYNIVNLIYRVIFLT